MPDEIIPKENLKKLESYLQILLDGFYSIHGDSNIQIFFSQGSWGFINDGEFNAIGTLDELVEWLQNHCEECKRLWEGTPEPAG